MKKKIKENLIKKGWNHAEVSRVESSFAAHKVHDKSNSKANLNRLVYWMALLIISICNFGIALFLIPFLMVLGSAFSTVIVLTLGAIFGMLFAFIIKDIENLERKHHIFAMIFIPLIALINIFIMVEAANFFDRFIQINMQHNPWILSSLYVLAFIIPYFIYNILQR